MEDLKETLDRMGSELTLALMEYSRFAFKGNASAGTRLRKHMQNIKAQAQEARVQVQELKNENKVL